MGVVKPALLIGGDESFLTLRQKLDAAKAADDFGLCMELQAKIAALGTKPLESLKARLAKAKAAEDWSECEALQKKIKSLGPKSRHRRVMERLLHYENYYSSGKDGHPRYYN